MGAINTRKGLIFFDFRYKGVRCREYTKLPDNAANRKRAKVVLERIEAEITLNTFDYSNYFPNSAYVAKFREHQQKLDGYSLNSPAFLSFAKTWFLENEVRWKPSYINTLKNSLDKHILPVFGKSPVSSVTKAEILAFRASLTKLVRPGGQVGLSPARVNHVMTPLRGILTEAADRFSFENPYKNIKPLKVPKTQVDPFSLDEVLLIIQHVRPDYQPF